MFFKASKSGGGQGSDDGASSIKTCYKRSEKWFKGAEWLKKVIESLKQLRDSMPRKDSVIQYSKIYITFFQILASFVTFNVKWPSLLMHAMTWIKGTLFLDILQLPNLACLWNNVNFQQRLLTYTLGPLVLIFFFFVPVLCAFFLDCKRGEQNSFGEHRKSLLDSAWRNILFLLFLVYPIVSLTTFQAFDCQPVGLGRLAADVSVLCPEGGHFLRVWSALFIFIYPLGVPLFCLMVMMKMGVHLAAQDRVDSFTLNAMTAKFYELGHFVQADKIAHLFLPITECCGKERRSDVFGLLRQHDMIKDMLKDSIQPGQFVKVEKIVQDGRKQNNLPDEIRNDWSTWLQSYFERHGQCRMVFLDDFVRDAMTRHKLADLGYEKVRDIVQSQFEIVQCINAETAIECLSKKMERDQEWQPVAQWLKDEWIPSIQGRKSAFHEGISLVVDKPNASHEKMLQHADSNYNRPLSTTLVSVTEFIMVVDLEERIQHIYNAIFTDKKLKQGDDLENGFRTMGLEAADKNHFQSFIESYDKDKNGEISLVEFRSMAHEIIKNRLLFTGKESDCITVELAVKLLTFSWGEKVGIFPITADDFMAIHISELTKEHECHENIVRTWVTKNYQNSDGTVAAEIWKLAKWLLKKKVIAVPEPDWQTELPKNDKKMSNDSGETRNDQDKAAESSSSCWRRLKKTKNISKNVLGYVIHPKINDEYRQKGFFMQLVIFLCFGKREMPDEWKSPQARKEANLDEIARARVGFVFQAYKVQFWFWEMIEMMRK